MSEELEQYQKEMSYKRKVNAQARAIIGRAKQAGIPEKYMRIGPNQFEGLLCPTYHTDPKSFTNLLYNHPEILTKQPFIVIDGGNVYQRKKAGFAMLFRLIACDKHGQFVDCAKLSSEFQSIRFGKGEVNRNDLVDELKKENILFVGEVSQKKFKVHFDSGNFFDQVLEYRDDYDRPTILTFSQELEGANGYNSGNAIKDDNCGMYISLLSHADLQKNENVLRIRVK